VQLGGGSLPNGIKLRVRASNDAGAGDGNLGTKQGWCVINNNAKIFIGDIGSCYTGSEPNKGHTYITT